MNSKQALDILKKKWSNQPNEPSNRDPIKHIPLYIQTRLLGYNELLVIANTIETLVGFKHFVSFFIGYNKPNPGSNNH